MFWKGKPKLSDTQINNSKQGRQVTYPEKIIFQMPPQLLQGQGFQFPKPPEVVSALKATSASPSGRTILVPDPQRSISKIVRRVVWWPQEADTTSCPCALHSLRMLSSVLPLKTMRRQKPSIIHSRERCCLSFTLGEQLISKRPHGTSKAVFTTCALISMMVKSIEHRPHCPRIQA